MIPLSENFSGILRRIWTFLIELPFLVTYDKRNVHNRSIVRTIGSVLPLAPAPRVYFNLAGWNPELERFTDDSGCEIFSPNHQTNTNYQRQIDELQEELKTIKDKLAILLEKESTINKMEKEFTLNKTEKITITNGKSETTWMPAPPPPPPPPPPPMPDLNFTTSKPPRLVKPKKHIPRSPGGRPIKPKRDPEIDPNDILALVLKKRYSAIQDSSDAESFNASFTDITSPLKSAAC